MLVGFGILAAYAAIALFSPFLVSDYVGIDTAQRLKPPGALHWFGTDHLGREILGRALVGTRTSLAVGGAVAAIATVAGVLLGLYAGYFRLGDRLIMRVMDGLMAIPGILLAIALASLLGGGLGTLIVAISVPEIPRMARLTRSVVLSLKEQPFVTAAVSIGTSTPKILFMHILPNSVGALTVQATYVCAAAIITEAVLSFLGVGTPPEIPSWGNIMSAGRQYFQLAPWIIGFPGLMLSLLVLAINLLGDSLRDRLDPRLTRKSSL
ncbi:MAG: ABC transporter permease [Bauldia sp.]|nr:ABC transporter permease [Bauldia sp.]